MTLSVWRRLTPAVMAGGKMVSDVPTEVGVATEASDVNRTNEEDILPDSGRRGRHRRRPCR